MIALLMSLLMTPASSQAMTPAIVHHYAEVVSVETDGGFPVTQGKVTFMQDCGSFSPRVELSAPQLVNGVEQVKLRVELSSYNSIPVCLAMPVPRVLPFVVSSQLPVQIIPDVNFNRTAGVLYAGGLNRLILQPGSVLSKQNISYANVAVDFGAQQITLTLQARFHCPPGMMCAQVMPAPIEIHLPLVDVRTGSCGQRIYTAKVDHRPVDGAMKMIRVVDNTSFICKSLIAVSPTVVTYSTETGRPHLVEHHRFEGDAALAEM